MKRPSPAVERLLVGSLLAVTFLVMASVFVPDLGHAQPPTTPGPSAVPLIAPPRVEPAADPHAGLPSLGTIEDNEYLIRVYGGDAEPRYSIYRRSTGEELAVLLPAYAVQQQFPELPLLDMDFGAESPVMMAEPEELHFR